VSQDAPQQAIDSLRGGSAGETAAAVGRLLSVTEAAYERRAQLEQAEALRSNSHHFAVYPGHVAPDVERVVAQRAGYEVVEKVEPLPRLIAESTDPRSD
jgi:hypothetical protein